jgi:hypothetical protein
MDKSDISISSIIRSALLSLIAAAGLLLAGYILYLAAGVAEGTNTEHEKVLQGREFRAAIGAARAQGDDLVVTGYRPNRNEHHAMLVTDARFRADNYPLLTYRYSGEGPGPMLKLVWRSAADPGSLLIAEINRSTSGAGTLNLGRHPAWRGGVIELGIYAVTLVEDEDFALQEVRLRPYTWQGVIAAHWSDWRAYRGWTVKTINFIRGTPDSEALSPVPVAAAWVGVSLLILLVLGRLTGTVHPAAVIAVVLVPWLALDLLWQGELNSQRDETQRQFGGKNAHEQHLADIDSHIYGYVHRLKTRVLPADPARILLLHNSKKHNFNRLKSQYYLLPHNVFNYGDLPPKEPLGTLDYILMLGVNPDVVFEADAQRLRWKEKRTLAVELVDSDPMGQLYRVTGKGMVEDKKK